MYLICIGIQLARCHCRSQANTIKIWIFDGAAKWRTTPSESYRTKMLYRNPLRRMTLFKCFDFLFKKKSNAYVPNSHSAVSLSPLITTTGLLGHVAFVGYTRSGEITWNRMAEQAYIFLLKQKMKKLSYDLLRTYRVSVCALRRVPILISCERAVELFVCAFFRAGAAVHNYICT